MNVERWLRDRAREMPPPEMPTGGRDRIVAGVRRRQLHRRAGGAVLMAGLVGLSIPIVSSTLSADQNDPQRAVAPSASNQATSSPDAVPASPVEQLVVPWIAAEGTPYREGPSGLSPCRASDIVVTVGRTGAYHGTAAQMLTLTNRSQTPCVLNGPPATVARAPSGPKSTRSGSPLSKDQVELAPSGEALLAIGAPAGCGEAPPEAVARQLTVRLSLGTSPRTIDGVRLPLHCGAPSVQVFEARTAEPASEDPRSELDATWIGPDSAVPGGSMEYVIRLTNPTDSTIDLTPCPSYTHGADAQERTFLLNCGPVGAIKPGQSVDFEMRMDIPQEVPPSLVKVGWHLEVEDGPTAGREVRVVDPVG